MAVWSLLSLCILYYFTRCSGDFTDDPTSSTNFVIVETGSGKLVGRKQGSVNSFLGIPYAEKPIGRFRFRPPRPKRPWYPVLYQALNYGPECLQSILYSNNEDTDAQEVPMDEDCLYLNIWQPSKVASEEHPEKLYPVMIWIYGGAFIHGSASKAEYEGSKLAARRNGVIVVSFNYRLGALGFLVSTADGLYGNYGLADQKTAIQWVKDNILHFGGDPNRITLFGESAGAMSIGLHMLDQEQHLGVREEVLDSENEGEGEGVHSAGVLREEQKLFHSVILQSNPLGYKYRSIAVANFIGTSYKEHLDCDDLRCLQSESADELIHVQDTLMAVPRSIGDFFTWGPVVTDQAYFREVRLFPGPLANVTVRQPIEALQAMRSLSVPVVIGTNSHEGTVFVFTAYPTRMAKFVFQALVFSFFRFSAPRVLQMYAPLTKMLSRSPYPDYRLVLSRIIGDYLFKCPNGRFASLLATAGAPVFNYEFALPTRTPGFPCCDGLSCHTCELPFVFNQMGVIESDYSWQEGNNIPYTTKSTDTSSTGSNTEPATTTSTTVPASHSIAAESVGGAPAGSKGGVVDGFISTDWDNLPDSPIVGGRSKSADDKASDRSTVPTATKGDTTNTNTYPYTTTANARNADSFPDIFGAAAHIANTAYSTLTGQDSGSVYDNMYKTVHNMYKSRRSLDSEVSGLMSDYWTTFTTYGDPNGQPFVHSSDYSAESDDDLSGEDKSGPSNGYVAGTRVDSQPWWPRLLGDLPMSPPRRYTSSGTSGDGDSSDGPHSGSGVDGGDSSELSPDPITSIIHDLNARTTHPADSTAPTIRSAMGSREDTAWATAKLHSKSNSVYNKHSTPTPPTDRDNTNTKHTQNSFDILLELNTNRNLIHKLKSNYVQSVQYMHQMVFDEASSVNIIENDCLCNQWNELNYRF